MEIKIEIRSIIKPDEMRKTEDLQRLIWPGADRDIVPDHMLLAVARNGGIVLGAFDQDHLVGFVLGFLGTDSETASELAMTRLKHHSHMLGVHPEYRNLGIGYQLKLAQRELVMRQGVRLITWTYDPLQSRNGYLNISRLGCVCGTYEATAYGEMDDALNVGIPSDRFMVDWWITSPRVRARVEQKHTKLDLAHYLAGGAKKLNPTTLDARGLPVPPETIETSNASILLIEIPSDYQKIKELDHALALLWRMQTRQLFEDAFSQGYLVTDFIHFREEKIPRSFYVLIQGEMTLG